MSSKYDKLYLFAAVVALIGLALESYNWFVGNAGRREDVVVPVILASFALFMWWQWRKRATNDG